MENVWKMWKIYLYDKDDHEKKMVNQGPSGSHGGGGHCDLGREVGVVDSVKIGGWAEQRQVTILLYDQQVGWGVI